MVAVSGTICLRLFFTRSGGTRCDRNRSLPTTQVADSLLRQPLSRAAHDSVEVTVPGSG